MNSSQTPASVADALFAQGLQAARSGAETAAVAAWQAALQQVPDHARALAALAQHAMRQRDFERAIALLERLTRLEPGNPQHWLHLAMVHRGRNDEAREAEAITRVLEIDPQDLMALVMRGKLLERQGRRHEAAAAYRAGVAVAPPLEQLVAELRPSLRHAQDFCARYSRDYGAFIDSFLASQAGELHGAELDRFRLSLDIMLGRKKRYDAQPVGYFFPGLRPVEFFAREEFPWLDELEASTDAIRDEFLDVLQADDGFSPYITYANDQPLAQWAELNNSPRWSAFHLLKDGSPVPANAARCPRTMAALAKTPQPDQPGRTPVAMFSLLKPRTHIPAHVGISNARLVTHLPLIVPERCAFRVGNETRQWQAGKAWVFDDTIEHEAWNDSDKLRVVLIFDIWHPRLSEAERRMITAMNAAQNAFLGQAGGFEL